MSIQSTSSQDKKAVLESAGKSSPITNEEDSWRARGEFQMNRLRVDILIPFLFLFSGKFRKFRGEESDTGNASEPDDIEDERTKRPFQAKKLKSTNEPIVMNIRVSDFC